MTNKIKITVTVDVDTPFEYHVISHKGAIVKGKSDTTKFKIAVKPDEIYQLVINNGLSAMFKSDEDKAVTVNALTTVATVFCFSQLTDRHAHIGDKDEETYRVRLDVAYAMMTNFVSDNGISSTITSPPNALETNSLRLFNFLSNIVADTVINKVTRKKLLSITDQHTVLAALHHIATHPFDDIATIFKLGEQVPKSFEPTIESIKQIGQFALSIKVNDTGSLNYLAGGPAVIVFDKYQKPWVSLNTTQGTDGSNTFSMVLRPDAKPASFSPVFPVLGGAYGVAYDKIRDRIIFGSFGWGAKNYAYNPFIGSINIFDAKTGIPITPPSGYTNQLHRVQGIAVDSKGNYWMCSWGSNDPLGALPDKAIDSNNFNSSIVVYIDGDPTKAITYEIRTGNNHRSPDYGPFSVAIDSEDNAFISCGGSNKDKKMIKSAVIKLALNSDHTKIKKLAEYQSDADNFYKGIAINSKDEIYVASFKEDKIIKLSNDLKYLTQYYSENSGPWGVHIDAKDNIWVANFLPENIPLQDFSVSQLSDHHGKIKRIGKFTLPSGGDPVTLATGRVIKDHKGKPVMSPLMRLTYAVPDAAGNVYVANNWKPSIVNDILEDPGGDGLVIFIGSGAPRDIK